MPKKKNWLILFAVSTMFISCNTKFHVINTNTEEINDEGIIYTLPKTKISITFEVTEINKQKGPFAEYAHLYFNSKNVIFENSTEYYISDVTLKTIPISDSENIYSITPAKNTVIGMINLTPEGFIAGINLSDYQAEKAETEQITISKTIEKDNQPVYGDLSLKSIIETKYDTLYKEVLKDSVLVKVPVISKKDIYKSDSKQAKEIADILFLLRDDRNALLIGENDGDNFPDGQALSIMLKEVNELEKQYMSLFTGREIKTKREFEYEIVPNTDSLEFYLADFSENKGISEKTNKNPLLLKLYLNNAVANTNDFSEQIFKPYNSNKKPYNGLVYRIPANVSAEIYRKGALLYKKNIKVSQLGSLNIIPGNIFNEEVTVEFYTQNGSLKRISKFKSE